MIFGFADSFVPVSVDHSEGTHPDLQTILENVYFYYYKILCVGEIEASNVTLRFCSPFEFVSGISVFFLFIFNYWFPFHVFC